MRGFRVFLMLAFALPIVQIVNLAAYARTQEGWVARTAVIVSFIPIMVFTTLIWLAAWIATVSTITTVLRSLFSN